MAALCAESVTIVDLQAKFFGKDVWQDGRARERGGGQCKIQKVKLTG
jgi:hypothetical protein